MTTQPTDLRLAPGVGLAAMLEDGAFLIAAIGDGVPDTVEVRPNGDPALAWSAVSVSWPLIRSADGPRSGFVAIFPLPARERANLKTVTVGAAGRPIALALQRPLAGIDAVFAAIAAEAGPSYARVVDGLVEILLAGDAGPARARAAARLLATAARPTGYVEIVGAASGDEVFVQGWASELVAGRTRILAVGDPPIASELVCATYERQDVSGRGRGFAGIVEPAPAGDPDALKHLYFRAEDGWCRIELYDRRNALAPRDVPAHLRALLDRASAPQDAMARLRRVAHRFDGRETVSQARDPVRLGIDLAVAAPGGGILVAGWLLDPRNSVHTVRLCAGNASAVVSDDWTRLPRPDVADAFAAEPQFRAFVAGRPLSGFLAYAPGIEAVEGETRLELDFGGGEPPAYFPIEISRAPLHDALAGLLAAIDPRSAAADRAVEHQFAPLLAGARTAGRPAPSKRHVGRPLPDDASVTLVIGGDRHIADAIGILAILGVDPHARALPLVIAAPAEGLGAVGGEIARLATFYGLSIDIVETPRGATAFDSLVVGAAAADTPALLLLSVDTLPLTADWLPRLLAAYRLRGERHIVCPTILFEDRSVRWGGAWREGEGGSHLATPNLGLPAEAVAASEVREVAAGTLECCILPRAALVALADTAGTLVGAAARNVDLALRLAQTGTPALWVPDVVMIAADGALGDTPLGRRIDAKLLETRWSA